MRFVDIKDYINRAQIERQTHLKLAEECIEIGGSSRTCRSLLAHYLKTTVPSGMKIHLCHACNNRKCSNPNHLYWGTPRENILDNVANGTWTRKGVPGHPQSKATKRLISQARKNKPSNNKLGVNQYAG